MSDHTPGPWEVRDEGGYTGGTPDGSREYTACLVIRSEGRVIVQLGEPEDEEDLANMELMARAPEMAKDIARQAQEIDKEKRIRSSLKESADGIKRDFDSALTVIGEKEQTIARQAEEIEALRELFADGWILAGVAELWRMQCVVDDDYIGTDWYKEKGEAIDAAIARHKEARAAIEQERG